MAGPVEITDHTAAVLKKVKQLSGDDLREFTETAVEFIKRGAPYDTGNHRDTIHYEYHGIRKTKAAEIFSQSNYGVYLEYGTTKMRAQPHFRPGIDAAVSEFNKDGKWGE